MTESSRQAFLGNDSARLFADTRVGIIGLCGGGSHISQQLAHLGVGKFVLIDFDHVEASNLNRMVGSRFAHAQQDAAKTDVISSLIQGINPRAEIKAFATRWEDNHQHLRDCTVVFGCVDSFLARDQLEKYCRRFLIPYIDIGMDVSPSDAGFSISGQVVTSIPGLPCMRCLGFLSDRLISDEVQRYGAAGPRPQVVWPNGVLASTAVGVFVQMLAPWRSQVTELYIEYDGNKPSLTPSRLSVISNKRQCTHFAALMDVGDVV
jgi:hypothetical protein